MHELEAAEKACIEASKILLDFYKKRASMEKSMKGDRDFATEAGGIATDFNGNKATTSTRNTILSNRKIHKEILSAIVP